MEKLNPFDIQIIICSGRKDIEKITAGLAMALSCASSGARVVVFLTMEAAAFADPHEGKTVVIHGFEPIQKYFELLLEENVCLEACTSCVENYCYAPINKETGQKIIHPNMSYVGMSTAAIRAINTPTIVF